MAEARIRLSKEVRNNHMKNRNSKMDEVNGIDRCDWRMRAIVRFDGIGSDQL